MSEPFQFVDSKSARQPSCAAVEHYAMIIHHETNGLILVVDRSHGDDLNQSRQNHVNFIMRDDRYRFARQ
ncbi:MAG: hypothetical protein QM703_09765 [Gemmatales bacterium]